MMNEKIATFGNYWGARARPAPIAVTGLIMATKKDILKNCCFDIQESTFIKRGLFLNSPGVICRMMKSPTNSCWGIAAKNLVNMISKVMLILRCLFEHR